MSSLEQIVEQFNYTYKVEESLVPRLPTEPEATRMHLMIYEEVCEMNEELDSEDLPKLAKELTDILYVTAQQMSVLGLPVDALIREVHRSNMSKLDVDGKPLFRHDGKVLKGPLYEEADIIKVLRVSGYEDKEKQQ